MQLSSNAAPGVSTDFELIEELLAAGLSDPAGATLVELGCGAALTTRQLAERHPDCRILAFEVDRIQHAKNRQIDDLPNVRFRLGGAEQIDLPDDSVDAVLMLKSLHHVAVPLMDEALDEIARVLRPGGLAYISEPVYEGAFNEILRLFHDEKAVREAAFGAITRAAERGLLELDREVHFLAPSSFDGFADFEARIIGATHTDFAIDAARHDAIRAAFMRHINAQGIAEFLNPLRVDLLRKAG